MRFISPTISVLCAALLVLIYPTIARADREAELQAKFKERFAEIEKLKASGAIGETWDGWLAAVKGNLDVVGQKLIDAENADRKELYQIIAEKEKTTADLVGQRNAQRSY